MNYKDHLRYAELLENIKVVIHERLNWDLNVLKHRLNKVDKILKAQEDGTIDLDAPEIEVLVEQYGYYKGKIEMLTEILDELEYIVENDDETINLPKNIEHNALKDIEAKRELEELQKGVDEYLNNENEHKIGDVFEIDGLPYKLTQITHRSSGTYYYLYNEDQHKQRILKDDEINEYIKL